MEDEKFKQDIIDEFAKYGLRASFTRDEDYPELAVVTTGLITKYRRTYYPSEVSKADLVIKHTVADSVHNFVRELRRTADELESRLGE